MQDTHRQQNLYWNQLVELKVAAECIRLQRNNLARWDRWTNTIKAIASSGSIAAWAIWQSFSFVWAAIIVVAQLLDALKDVFPFSKRLKAASELTALLERLFIDTQFEWENIFRGKLSDDEIIERWRKLLTIRHDAENKAFPDGFEPSPKLFALAKEGAVRYLRATYKIQE